MISCENKGTIQIALQEVVNNEIIRTELLAIGSFSNLRFVDTTKGLFNYAYSFGRESNKSTL